MATIYEAVEQGSLGGVFRLLRAGCDPNWAPEGIHQSPLGLAAAKGYGFIASALISHSQTILGGGDINGGPSDPPISLAAGNGRTNIVNALIQAGVDVNETNRDGCTPLHIASSSETPSIRIIELLLDAGAEINALMPNGATPLMLAAYCGNFEILKYLLERGADPQLIDARGMKALHLTLNFKYPANDEVLELILSLEPDLDLEERKLEPATTEQIALLMRAAFYGRTNAAQILLRKGAQVDTRTASGLTALHLACSRHGNYDIVKLLIDHGADVNSSDPTGQTPFHRLCSHVLPKWTAGAEEAALLLLQHGADATAKDNSGVPAVHFALTESPLNEDSPDYLPQVCRHWTNIPKALDFLKSIGVDVLSRDLYHRNALHRFALSISRAPELAHDGVPALMVAVLHKLADMGVRPTLSSEGHSPLSTLMSKISQNLKQHVAPIVVALIAAGDSGWSSVPFNCRGLGGGILSVWKNTPEHLYNLFYHLSDEEKARCREALRVLRRGLPDRALSNRALSEVPELRMRILSDSLSA